MAESFRWRELLTVLVNEGVAFVVVGGLAANYHGSPTVTRDVDICYERSDDNLARLAVVLESLNAHLRGVEEDVPFRLEPATLRAGDTFTFSTDLGALDVIGTPAGTRGYDELVRNAEAMGVGVVTVRVAALQDLIRMKRAAGRPKDRVELEILGALAEEIEGSGNE